MMSKIPPRFKFTAIMIPVIFISLILVGCSGTDSSDGGTSLNVVLKTYQAGGNLPASASKFQVEMLDENGKEMEFQEVSSDSSASSILVTFSSISTGSRRVRVSAFDSNNSILGTYNEPITVTQGENTANVESLEPAEVYYSAGLNLPQTKNSQGLTDFLSCDQSGIHLQSYCFWGKLVEDGKPVNAYLSIVQRLDEEIPDFGTYLFPFVIAGAGFNNPETAHIIFGGSYGIAELTETVTVTQPWHAHVESPNSTPTPYPANTTDMMVVSGTMGEAGAQYKITSKTKDLDGGALETEVIVTDVMGMVNEGYGPASFFPQWLLTDQRKIINDNYNGSVGDYLEAAGNPMTDQGSYYYSAPMLQVDSFSIVRNGEVICQGTDGLLWMDVVYQSFDSAAQDVVKTATWDFFTMQLPDRNEALMVTCVHNDVNGDLPAASLFTLNGPRTANGALSPEYRWNLQDIEITPASDHTWTSPVSNLTYYTQYNIKLSGTHQANMTITMDWDEQELSVNNTVKYEGFADVTGTLDGENVEGSAWVELQPAGHL